MDSNRPEDVSKQLFALLDRGDLDAVIGLYEADAVFADLDGSYVGSSEIRIAHERFRDSGLKVSLNESVTFQADDLALVHRAWTVSDGDGFSAEGSSAEVLRRQSDGSWKFVIDNSDGPGLIGRL